MLDFSKFKIHFCLGPHGHSVGRGNCTWSNNCDSQAWSRIDRFLLSTNWEEHFFDVSRRHLPRILSYHFPLMFDCGMVSKGNRFFKFENMWRKSKGFCGAGENIVGIKIRFKEMK
jgi:hypothetical protein